jgi:hypothetical protein
LDPNEVEAAGIRVYRYHQVEGEIILGRGDIFHWGHNTSLLTVSQAVNFVDKGWLTGGIPMLLSTLSMMSEFLKDRVKRTKRIQRMINICPNQFCILLCKKILTLYCSHDCSDVVDVKPLIVCMELCKKLKKWY